MAVAARPQVAGGSTGLKVALVVFVCVAVGSLAWAVIMYTGQEDIVQKREAAEKSAQAASQKEQEARELLRARAFDMMGTQTDDSAEITTKFDAVRGSVFGKDASQLSDVEKQVIEEAGIHREDPLLTTMTAMYKDLVAKTQELNDLKAEAKKLTEELASRTAALKTVEDRFAADADKIKGQLAEIEDQLKSHREAWDKSLADLHQQSDAEAERASAQLNAERKQRQTLEQKLAENKTRIDELVSTLASFRPSADTMSLLQISDGTIVQSVVGQGIVYISLGVKDHIKPGMTFAVYSRTKGIPADGKGKATVKVTSVFEITSECQVTSSSVSEPIVEGDVIANPVYSRDRKYNFVVAGDFDLDMDGRIEDPGGEQVKRMIRDWGGQIQDHVDTTTDFVVLGAAPFVPKADDEGAANEIAAKRAAYRKQFDTARDEAKALSLPVLTRTQFLHFIGFEVPTSVKGDKSPI